MVAAIGSHARAIRSAMTGEHHLAGPSEAGAVVLDIGRGAGAAVVRTSRDMCDQEIELRGAGEPWRGRHVSVRPRTGHGRTQYAAIFGGLPTGCYELRVLHGAADEGVLVVEVHEAMVTLIDWPVR